MRKAASAVVIAVASSCLAAASHTVVAQQTSSTKQRMSFALGADISELPVLEKHGAVYKSNGQPADPIAILKRDGFNWMRVRLFVHPTMVGPESNDLDADLGLAQRVKADHLSLLLDMFYSDTWADPQKQGTPAAWRGLSHQQLARQLQKYNRDVIRKFRKHHAFPDMVEVGNEITNGMLWPDGRVSLGDQDEAHWQRLGELLRAAISGVQEGSGRHAPPVIMLHIDRGGDKESSLLFYKRVLQQQVNFDVIGLSDYPWWQGSLGKLKDNLEALTTLHKPIIVVETSFPFVPQEFTESGKTLTPEDSVEQVLHFSPTPEGQAAYARALMQTVQCAPDGLGDGVFYWAASWTPTRGWGAPSWSADWEGRALFDKNGNELPVTKAFGESADHICKAVE